VIRNIKLAAVLAVFCAALCAQGAEDTYCSCPRDPRFLAYMRAVARIYAANHPASVWIDDDLRIDNHDPATRGSLDGCWCKTCIAEFNAETSGKWTRETLAAAARKNATCAVWREIRREPVTLSIHRADGICRVEVPSIGIWNGGFLEFQRRE